MAEEKFYHEIEIRATHRDHTGRETTEAVRVHAEATSDKADPKAVARAVAQAAADKLGADRLRLIDESQ